MKSGAGLCCEGRDRTSDLRVMSPTSYRCSTSRCLDGKDRRLLLLDQVYTYQIETSAESGNVGFWRDKLAHGLAQLF